MAVSAYILKCHLAQTEEMEHKDTDRWKIFETNAFYTGNIFVVNPDFWCNHGHFGMSSILIWKVSKNIQSLPAWLCYASLMKPMLLTTTGQCPNFHAGTDDPYKLCERCGCFTHAIPDSYAIIPPSIKAHTCSAFCSSHPPSWACETWTPA